VRRRSEEEESAKAKHDAREEIKRKNEMAELKEILNNAKVRTFLYRMMGRCKMFNDSFSPNAAVMAYQVGQSSAGKMIYSEISEAWPEAWLVMQEEALMRQRAEEALLEIEAQEALDEKRATE
jgi:hypothetical protein